MEARFPLALVFMCAIALAACGGDNPYSGMSVGELTGVKVTSENCTDVGEAWAEAEGEAGTPQAVQQQVFAKCRGFEAAGE